MHTQVSRQGEDTRLWQLFREGDRTAFTSLYNAYVQALYNYGRRFTTDTALIEDCIQDLFIDLWRKKDQLADADTPRYYLLKSLRNRLLRRLNQRQRFASSGLTDEYDFQVEVSYELTLVNEQWAADQQRLVNRALQSLSKRQREVIYLKFYENFSYEDIARIMSLEVASAYNLVSKALDSVRRHLPAAYAALLLILLIA
ncbi:MAG: sigma-70 family RNA polymerase sigma factor [Cytophagales bacterium]|jgi:RNA polymerase sigma factor (sigma-70 family)|nr:sigma-70 family RNA polymerase sigma factor [Cytophagales bacterium]